jgi:serine/threonine protein kinase
VLSLLGAGGMGEVYTAYDPALDRRVALKVIKPYADKGSLSGARGALLAEAQALAKLAHPNIVAVYDVGTIDDDVYMAMEHVEGITLNAWMQVVRSPDEIIDTFVAAGRGLEAAHAVGIVHRDFKPDNVILGKDGRVRVIDFGIAQQGPAEASEAIVGTVAYMAPEQFQREKVGPAADQFSFAVALYTAMFRQYPFEGDTEDAISTNICSGKILPPPANSRVPARLRDAILRALSVKPELRFPTLHELLVTLKPPPRRSRIAWAIAGTVTLAAAGAITLAATRNSGAPEPCRGFERDLGGIWDSARKVAIQVQVKADAWPAIEKLFDTYAGDWTRNKQSACRATAVTREQTPLVLERRMTCLDTRLRELDAAVAGHSLRLVAT